MRDRNGDEVQPEDVLAPDELADYYAQRPRRHEPEPWRPFMKEPADG